MLTLAVALGMATSSYGQHSFTPEDIANGGQLYRSNCLSCHGPSGDAVPNSPLMNGKFRRGNSDEELIKIIRNGISGTAMVAQPSLNEVQAGTIVGFLRSVATSIPSTSASAALPSGDSGRGKQLFEGKGNCLSCHRVADKGSQFGPDLSSIGSPAVGRGGRGGGGPAPAAGAEERRPQRLPFRLCPRLLRRRIWRNCRSRSWTRTRRCPTQIDTSCSR